MSYALSFAETFFWGDDDIPPECIRPSERPTSVFQALRSLPNDRWESLARDVFGVDPDLLECETVLAKVLETNTCRNLDPPVEVFIDPEGTHSVLVY